MIKRYFGEEFKEQPSLLAAAGLEDEKSPVVCVIGAGGKTRTIKRLVGEYKGRGIPVVVTTSTHMMLEDEPWFLLQPSKEKALRILEKEGTVWIGEKSCKGGKMQAPDSGFLEEMRELGYPLLVEADGAKRLPLKAPGEFEPVYLAGTTHVLGLYGLDSIGKKLKDVCFRASCAAGILGKDIEDVVCPQDIAGLMLDARAGRKNLPCGAKYQVILNKADIPMGEEYALSVCFSAKKRGFCDIIATGL